MEYSVESIKKQIEVYEKKVADLHIEKEKLNERLVELDNQETELGQTLDKLDEALKHLQEVEKLFGKMDNNILNTEVEETVSEENTVRGITPPEQNEGNEEQLSDEEIVLIPESEKIQWRNKIYEMSKDELVKNVLDIYRNDFGITSEVGKNGLTGYIKITDLHNDNQPIAVVNTLYDVVMELEGEDTFLQDIDWKKLLLLNCCRGSDDSKVDVSYILDQVNGKKLQEYVDGGVTPPEVSEDKEEQQDNFKDFLDVKNFMNH